IYDKNSNELKKPICVEQITIRGTQSTYSAGAGFYGENPDKPNIQRIEIASLPENSDTFECHFSLNIVGNCTRPAACNSEEFNSQIKEFVHLYTEKKGFEFLSSLYIEQIINAS
ncbi:MAG: type I-F CRISPR-associated protein Cas7f/Csy3, partial [Candidatus Fonsibacter sp.]